MPTPEQLESRSTLDAFMERMKQAGDRASGVIKSKWFGRPDKELQGWVERGRAIHEIEDSMGYQLIVTQADREIVWAQQQLEVCDQENILELRCYLKSLRFLKNFILETTRSADAATDVLAGRERAIGMDSHTFVRNARVEGAN